MLPTIMATMKTNVLSTPMTRSVSRSLGDMRAVSLLAPGALSGWLAARPIPIRAFALRADARVFGAARNPLVLAALTFVPLHPQLNRRHARNDTTGPNTEQTVPLAKDVPSLVAPTLRSRTWEKGGLR